MTGEGNRQKCRRRGAAKERRRCEVKYIMRQGAPGRGKETRDQRPETREDERGGEETIKCRGRKIESKRRNM